MQEKDRTSRGGGRRRSLALGLGTLAAAGAAAGTPREASAQASGESRLETVMRRGRLLVATFGTAPPLCYTDDRGQHVGFEIDLARQFAKGLFDDESKIEFVTVDSSGRWPAVISGRADFGIASTTVYPDRAARVAFAQPYMDSGVSVLARKDTNVTSLGALNNARFTLANLSNPQMADRARRFLPNMRTVTFETPSAMFLAVKSGQAQAMQMDTPVVDWYATNNSELTVLPQLLGSVQNNAIFLRPGDFTWWRWLDTVVQELRWGSRYDDYTTIFKKWFGRNPPPQRFYMPASN
jgi:polar amino acid transport system substrate-binding protein